MNKEEKDILLKDLSARLPYEVKLRVETRNSKMIETLTSIDTDMWYDNSIRINNANWFLDEVKPYLFPLYPMTKKQVAEYRGLCDTMKLEDGSYLDFDTVSSIDWLNAHHFDFRNLINRNLAIDATGLNIY